MSQARLASSTVPVNQPPNKLRAKRGPVFHETRSRIRGHNFAIRLLQTLEARIYQIVEDFCVGEGIRRQHSTLDRQGFINTFLSHIRAGPRSSDEDSWLASMPEMEIMEKLGEVFDAADTSERGRISFSTLMSYVIDCARYGEVGAVQEAIPEYIGTQGTFFRSLEDISKAKYCPELQRVMCSGKSIGLVQTQNLHVKSFAPYPHMVSASEKFATTYDMDYIPHLESIAFVGTDLFIDFIHAESGQNVMRIPVPQTYSVCSYDRTARLLLTARDNVVESYGLREFRTTDQAYHRGPTMNMHTGTIHCVKPLQRSGILATASSDKTVVISDLEVGEVVTTFRAHQHAVHSVEYIEHLNLMMSCGYDTEPKVWMLASSAMRSEAFTLRDVENPHTGVVVSACSIVDTPQLCTLDSHGAAKLWDVRMFRAQQTIRLEKTMDGIFDAKALKWHTVLWDPVAQELFACAQRRAQKLRRKVILREEAATSPTKAASPGTPEKKKKKEISVARSKTTSMADESPIVSVVYEPVSQTIVTLTDRKIRIWDLFTGHQEAVFDKLVPHETVATSVCVASSGKIFFLGLRNGRLTSHQYSSGSPLVTYVAEGPEILSLTYCSHAHAFCAITWRGARLFEDRHDNLASFFPDSLRGAEVKSATFDPLTNILCTVERKGNICMWESRSGPFTVASVKNCGTISLGHFEVTCALMLTGHAVLAVATHVGGLQLFTAAPHPVPNKKFAEGLFKSREITSMQYYAPKTILFCGDDQGWIHAVDVREALESVNCAQACGTWSHLMASAGRLGLAPREVMLLRTVHHVHAHSDSVGTLNWAIGCNLLISGSLDQRVLVWNLSLDFIGELDPLSEGGRYRVPMVTATLATTSEARPSSTSIRSKPPATGKEVGASSTAAAVIHLPYITQQAPSECVSFSSTLPQIGASESMTFGAAGESGGSTFSAATFAEDVHRIAAALESFVPSTRPDRDPRKKFEQLGVNAATSGYAKRASPTWVFHRVPASANGDSPTHSSPGGGRSNHEASEPGNEVLVSYSANSSGVECRSLFSPIPHQATRSKQIVVEQHISAGGEGDGTLDGATFTVTRNHPLPPNARRDRDFLIRELQLQEQAQAPPAPPPPVEQLTVVAPSASLLAASVSRRQTPLARVGSASGLLELSSLDGGPRPANDSVISQILPVDVLSNNSRPLSTAENFFYSGRFESLSGDAIAAGDTIQQKPVSLAKLYRALLPCELMQLKAEMQQRERQKRLDEFAARSRSTEPQRKIVLPVFKDRQATTSLMSGQHRLADDGIDWSQTLPTSQGQRQRAANGNASRSLDTTIDRKQSRGQTRSVSVLDRRTPFASCEDVPSVGYATFGVRSLTPMLVPMRDVKQHGWAKVHRVPQTEPVEWGLHSNGPQQQVLLSQHAGLNVPVIQGMPSIAEGDRPPRPLSRPARVATPSAASDL